MAEVAIQEENGDSGVADTSTGQPPLGKRIKGKNKGNQPWLRRRKDMKKIMFRGMR